MFVVITVLVMFWETIVGVVFPFSKFVNRLLHQSSTWMI